MRTVTQMKKASSNAFWKEMKNSQVNLSIAMYKLMIRC